MFEAIVLICMIGLPEINGNCEEVHDMRGPYATKHSCVMRVEEILRDLPKYRPYSYPKAYKCDKSTTKNEELT